MVSNIPTGRIQRAILDYLHTDPAGVDPTWGPIGVRLAQITQTVYGNSPTAAQSESARRAVAHLVQQGLVVTWADDDWPHRGRRRLWVVRPRTDVEQAVVDRHEAERQAQRTQRYRQGLVQRRAQLVTEIAAIDAELSSEEPVSIGQAIFGNLRKGKR